MMIARGQVQARFGHKQTAIALMHEWWREIAPLIGWSQDQVRILTGAVGERESAIDVEISVADLAALHDAWNRLAGIEAQAAWAEQLEPHIVSGTPRWTVLRVV